MTMLRRRLILAGMFCGLAAMILSMTVGQHRSWSGIGFIAGIWVVLVGAWMIVVREG